MQTSIYVGLSAQRAMLREIDSIAQNVANVGTVGFKGETMKFSAIPVATAGETTSYPDLGRIFPIQASGRHNKTGNPLDVAIVGKGYMAVDGGSGQIYTRDGRMTMTPAGALVTLSGAAVLDAGGAPIVLDPSAPSPQITRDGMITQAGRQIGAIGLYNLDPNANITRVGNASFSSDIPAQPILEFSADGFAQGYTEDSNVDGIGAMTRLISVQRMFEGLTSAMSATENSTTDMIKSLGPQGA